MMKYTIDLPLNYSDGRPIEDKKIRRVREELVNAFGSFAEPSQTAWRYDGVSYTEIIKIEIVTTNDKATKKYLTEFKERLKESLQQIDILITTHGIQVI